MTKSPTKKPLVTRLSLVALAFPIAGCAGGDPVLESIAQHQQQLTFVESSGIVSMEAENFTTNTSQGGKSWTSQTTNSPSNGSALIATPDSGTVVNTGYTTGSPRLNFDVNFAQTGTYQVWVRGRAGGSVAADSDSVHVGLDNVALASSDRITGFTGSFGWSRSTIDNVNATINVSTTGAHTVNVWMREDGFVVDKIVLARDSAYTPTGNGPAETPTPTSCSPTTYEAENMTKSTGGAVTGGWNIWTNGNVSTNHTFVNGQQTITVYAYGSVLGGVWPNMTVSVGGTQVGSTTVSATSWTAYSFTFSTTAGSKALQVAFTNDGTNANGEDRNLFVDKVVVTCGTGVCADGQTQPGTTACGLNGAGRYQQLCTGGAWANTTTCIDPDVCTNGGTRSGTTACGYNNRGTLNQVCTSGQWVNSATCVDPDVCADNSTQQGPTTCGLNGRGRITQLCTTGQWGDTATCVDPDVCVDATTQPGTTPCGLNDRGELDQVCTAGQWLDSTTCVDPDDCVDTSTQPGTTVCGLNGRGVLQLLCTAGSWEESAVCLDPDVCVDGSGRLGPTSCGLNGRGAFEQVCVTGAWVNTAVCQDADECVDGSTQPGTGTCGLNGRGSVVTVCTAGQWVPNGGCSDPDVCTDGAQRVGPTSCGLNNRGGLQQLCTTGQWADTATCSDPDVCVDASTRTGATPCGYNDRGTLDEVCTTGQWQDSATCDDPDECVDATTQPGTTACGYNGRGDFQQVCVVGSWEDSATCIDPDECVDGTTQTGPTACGLNNRGRLSQTCNLGDWVNTTTCIDTDVCVDGATRVGTTPCGAGGTYNQSCTTGQWVNTTCNLPSVCGNADCEQTENCNSCAADCGACPGNAFLESAQMVVMEAESFDSRNQNGSSDNWTSTSNTSASGSTEMMVGPDSGNTWTTNPTTTAPAMGYQVNFVTTGSWVMWIRGRSATSNMTSGDSCWGGIGSTANSSYFDFADNGAIGWFSKTITVPSAGVHTINIWAREDGFRADKIVLVKSTTYTPSGNGPAQSARGTAGTCGDLTCNPQEDCLNCPGDCGVCTVCGNGTCETQNEDCSSCAADCGACPIPGLDSRPSNTSCVAPAPLAASYQTTNKWPFTFTNPMMVTQPPGDSSRLIVVLRAGTARSVPVSATSSGQTSTFLTLSNVVTTSNGGFLSLAFHPNWATNRYAYVVYTTSNRMKRLSRFTSTDGGATLNASTELVILQSQHLTEFNHNGGHIAFGPDGYLYMSTGDDAYLDYTRARQSAQTNNWFGKMLRINVNSGSPYSIPPDNPFVSGGGSPEVYAYGLRNPTRFSFDRETGELWLADVGEDTWEEINIITPGFYGWPYYEGTMCFTGNATDCSTPYTPPETTYGGGSAQSVSGGALYRGSALPSLFGKYVYGDYVTGQISFYDPATGTKTDIANTASGGAAVAVSQDNAGELYVVRYASGNIQQVVAGSGGAADFPAQITSTGCFTTANPTTPVSGAIPYSIAQPFWSDGAVKSRYVALPNGQTITVDSTGDYVLPPGGVAIKSFRLNGQLFETRFFVRHTNGTYSGYTYQWNEAQTQATLVPVGGATRNIAGLTWQYPSRSQCFACHTAANNYHLGMETRQLNVDGFYPSTGRTANQHFTLDEIGYITGNVTPLEPFPAIDDETATLEERARAYLHVNCVSCHRPGGTGGGPMDARFDTPLASKGICNVNPTLGNLGVANAKLIKPGDHMGSIVFLRMSDRSSGVEMPPLASSIVDAEGAALLQEWIDSFTTCPAP